MTLHTEPYTDQLARWPTEGRHILAQFDDTSVVVYQAYRPQIGHYAVAHQAFGGEFSLSRMSWIKPNFLWMMHRSGWGAKPGQEVILVVHLKRTAFDEILAAAVHASYQHDVYTSAAEWQQALAASEVRVQWDPDHDPNGQPLGRRAIQLGLRGAFLANYAREWIIEIEDISGFVREQFATANPPYTNLIVPSEHVYKVSNTTLATRLGLISPNT